MQMDARDVRKLVVDQIADRWDVAGDADPVGFAVAACYATWSAINVDPPEGFDNQGWEQTT
jgi:hypothetical protein